ncbi:MAG: ATP-binding cassette domain-containing protein [Thiocapsa sp.]|jgi:ABC-type methionine transport system ATPase subunit|nr:ATP-binding cassette domain-containing protein [Thiocapsa sp.]MCG6897589.1 ATP-binding cassette domain-containing protein [Thiocapsa sp.]MCG6984695.1 ATP-binding cassette domain-containing protein [Thiocapsa sp.]
MPAALTLAGVYQHVAGRMALDDIRLSLPEGAWLLICGPNGAGKSLLTRLILGLDRPSAGTIRVLGQDLDRIGGVAMARLRREIGAVLQRGSLLSGHTVLDNLLLPLRDTPMSRSEMARAARLAMTLLGLDGLENHLPRALSLGQQRRVELARALIHRPKLLVWDGLSDGLDPSVARETLEVLHVLRENQNLTLVATDNRLDALTGTSDRTAVLERGRLLFEGTPAELEAASATRLDLRAALWGHP